MNEITWVAPLVILPAAGLLIVSTAARYTALHDEVHELCERGKPISLTFMRQLKQRSLLMRNALVALYISVTAFGMGSLCGAVTEQLRGDPIWIVIAFTCIGAGSLILGTMQLIVESSQSLKIIMTHLDEIDLEQ